MSRSARKSVATKELLRQVARRATGRMTVGSPSGALALYLMNGDIIGAVSPLDDSLVLRRVRLASGLPARRLAELGAVAAGGQSVFGVLLDEVPGDVTEPILFDRFRDNLVAFVAQDETPRFEPLGAVFVDNMQMGHNTARLIDSACKDADLAQRAPADTLVVLGPTPARDEVEQGVVDEAADEPRTVADLLSQIPVEAWLGRAIVASLLDSGALLLGGLEAEDLDPEPTAPESASAEPEPPIEPEPEPAIEPEPLAAVDGPADSSDDEPTLGDSLDEPTGGDLFEEPSGPVSFAPRPDDMALWVDGGDQMSDEDLAFFEDHEDDRGQGGGGFTTEMHNLDKVDVGGDAKPANKAPVAADAEVLEADEAPTARFSAPVLGEDDAIDKIAVCNDVLRKVCAAMDAAEGPGRGRAMIQLLVAGSDSKYTALLHDLSVSEDGEIAADEVLGNLAGRPPSEHRQLMNSALKNVIERALSSSADELPEEAFDELYESVAGYNQRLGL